MSPSAPAPDLASHRLGVLRAELDRIDDALHDLLMRRADVVTQVGALRAKGPVALRPGREAAILRRLLRRNDGALDPSTLVRVWREILSGSTAQQQAMSIVAPDAELLPLVRAHFGQRAAVRSDVGAAAALDLVAGGAASVAVLRWPGDWWPALLAERAMRVRAVARLPFWAEAGAPGALALTAAEPDPSGDDRSLIAGPLEAVGLGAALASSGFRLAGPAVACGGQGLAEVAGFVAPDDKRLQALPTGTAVVGAYAVPVGDAP